MFVDEYQDTDPAQVELLRQLAGDGRDLTVVGDPHQSIYAFRGAEVAASSTSRATSPGPTARLLRCSRSGRRGGSAHGC